MMTKKRKKNSTPDSSEKSAKRMSPSYICVIHNTKVPDTDTFICFSSVKCDPSKKLSKLLQIRETRLAESINSPQRMKDVCDMLPKTLDGLDLETTGYHRRCYQEFTAHLDRLQVAPRKMHHSPRKNKSAAASPVRFPL